MKKTLFFTTLFLCFLKTYASDSISNNSSIRPIKKVTKTPCPSKTVNCFSTCNPYKMNTLCRLIQVGNYTAVKSLVENGTEINTESVKLTPLMYAARHNRIDIVKLLIENGANLRTKSSRKGYTALNWAKHSNATGAYNIIYAALKNRK